MIADNNIRLADIPTDPPEDLDRDKIEDETKDLAKRIGELHRLLLAERKHSVLILLQGMDASGKDGAIRKIFRYCTHNHFGVYSFKRPTEVELAHDFLWRVHQQCPQKGELKIFNRSHYEDVLIQRVHKWVDEKRVDQRFDAINAFEKLLRDDGNTLILKFYLHISYEQQTEELQQRIDEYDKHWKHNPNDWKEREHWDEYMRCYEDVFRRSAIPWHIVPVDKRWYRNYIIAKTVAREMEALNMEYPPLPEG